MAKRHLIGLLLATEEDWPTAFESLLRRIGPIRWRGETHEFVTERSSTSRSTYATSLATS
jgi:hypothetical protein